MNFDNPLSRSTRDDETSIEDLEAQLAGKRAPPFVVATQFLFTVDAQNLDERIAQLSPRFKALIESTARHNILNFETVIAEIIRREGYPGGWMALRDWAQRQPWLAEAIAEAKDIQARSSTPDESAAAGQTYSEQGRMLGVLRVDLMRAKTDEDRAAIKQEIDELEAAFEKTNREALAQGR